MQLRITLLILASLFVRDSYSQVNITTFPTNSSAACQYDVNIETHPDYIAWRDNNGGGVASSECGGNITWTVTNENLDHQFGCSSGYIHVDWLIEDDCSNEDFTASSYFEIEGDYPNFPYPDDLTLDCGNPNNDMIVNDWVSNFGGVSLETDCSPASDFIVINDYDGTPPGCGDDEIIDFIIGDACVEYINNYHAQIISVQSQISFSEYEFVAEESSPTIEFCLQVTNADLDAAVDVVIEFSAPSYNPATNGVDYGPVNATETYTIPAGPQGEHCFTIDLIDDILVEQNEFVDLHIISITSPLNEVMDEYFNEAHLRITDDDDDDNDTIENSVDNCPNNSNILQEDIDNDGIGDVCDPENVVSHLHTVEDNVFLDKVSSGVITRSPDGNCWMMYVANNGAVRTISVVCPN